MINFKVSGIKNGKKAFMFVIAENWEDCIELSSSAVAKGFTQTIKRLDSIKSIEIVDEDVVMPNNIENVTKEDK